MKMVNNSCKILLIIGLFFIIQINCDCISNPNSTECITYQYPAANATADINSLCTSMFYMAACSIQKSCQSVGSVDGVCEPWSILADSCRFDMTMMNGCSTFNKICAPGSQVKSCTDYDGIPGLLSTKQLNTNVFSICTDMAMPSCSQCPIANTSTNSFLKCDLLLVYSELCMQMPDMKECSGWNEICNSDTSLYTSKISVDYCNQPVAQQVPIMRMFFHTGFLDYILFESWVPRTTGQFVGSWFICFLFAVIFECEKTLRSILEKRWDPNTPVPGANNESINDQLLKSNILKGYYPTFSYRDVIRGLLHGLELTMSYLLMLVAMTFNVGLFFSVIAGTVVGNIAVGRFRQYKPKVTCCD